MDFTMSNPRIYINKLEYLPCLCHANAKWGKNKKGEEANEAPESRQRMSGSERIAWEEQSGKLFSSLYLLNTFL